MVLNHFHVKFLLFLLPFLLKVYSQCVTNYDANVDYFTTKVNATVASLFRIEYYKNYKLVYNLYTNETFALYQCGTPIPSNLPAGTKNFSIPLSAIAILDSSEIPFLEALGLRSTIKVIDSSFASDIVSPCLQSEKSKIKTLDNNQTATAQILSTVNATFGNLANSSALKLISTSPVSDPGTLNRAEWIKFYSVFFNLEEKANATYNKISDNYNCLKKLATSHAPTTKPLVAWTQYDAPASYNNNTESWMIVDAKYKRMLIEDAGGAYFNSSTLIYYKNSEFLSAIANVDILIDETYIAINISDVYANYHLTATSDYKFVKNSAIYREDGLQNPGGGRDWFESAVLEDDAVLGDIVNIINPDLPKKGYQRVWFRNVAKGEVPKISSSDNCTDVNSTLTDTMAPFVTSGGAQSILESSKDSSSDYFSRSWSEWTSVIQRPQLPKPPADTVKLLKPLKLQQYIVNNHGWWPVFGGEPKLKRKRGNPTSPVVPQKQTPLSLVPLEFSKRRKIHNCSHFSSQFSCKNYLAVEWDPEENEFRTAFPPRTTTSALPQENFAAVTSRVLLVRRLKAKQGNTLKGDAASRFRKNVLVKVAVTVSDINSAIESPSNESDVVIKRPWRDGTTEPVEGTFEELKSLRNKRACESNSSPYTPPYC
ncbi:2726_t:CDS:2 [Acaulospora morrowiae]|uniref:2726_t:CDS:1 n=1 Tax=Acaulospora morrowiae TaxID=94023 RepID=A0A9N8VHM9_9GLOM|nr:2726_t:CDS:2 [Acaulospora morrowiae]